jgi:hypothetical protein
MPYCGISKNVQNVHMHGERLKQKFDHARMFNVNVIRPTHRNYGCDVLRHFQQYFNYIVEVSFIGRGNRNTRRKPPTYC